MASKRHYVDGERMQVLAAEAARDMADGGRGNEFPEELVEMFYTLARRTFDPRRPFREAGLDRDDVIQEAVIACFRATKHFAPNRGSAYSFYRTCIAHCFSNLWARANRQKRTPPTEVSSLDTLLRLERQVFWARESKPRRNRGACTDSAPLEPVACNRLAYLLHERRDNRPLPLSKGELERLIDYYLDEEEGEFSLQ